MANYTSESLDFKLIQASESVGISIRNARILVMLLNALGIEPVFHEFVLAVIGAVNWDFVHKDGTEIALQKLARKISPANDELYKKVYNRIRRNGPDYFKWQDQQPYSFIRREVIRYNTSVKIHTIYAFPYYHVIKRLFNLSSDMPENKLRRTVWEEAIKILGKNEPIKVKRKRQRKPETTAKSIRKLTNELVEQAGSVRTAIVYIKEADEVPGEGLTIKEFAESLIDNKGLRAA